jgi:hypothetical protein
MFSVKNNLQAAQGCRQRVNDVDKGVWEMAGANGVENNGFAVRYLRQRLAENSSRNSLQDLNIVPPVGVCYDGGILDTTEQDGVHIVQFNEFLYTLNGGSTVLVDYSNFFRPVIVLQASDKTLQGTVVLAPAHSKFVSQR